MSYISTAKIHQEKGCNIILGIQGEVATGKTTFAYTAPGRVVGFSFDLGADRAIYGTRYDELFANKKIEIVKYKKPMADPTTQQAQFKAEVMSHWNDLADILVFELPQPIQLDNNRVFGNHELWSYFMVLLGKTVEDDSIRSVVLDTVTMARRIKADAYMQELQEKQLAEKVPENKLRKQLIQIEWGHPNDTIRNIYTMFKGIGKNLITIHHLTDGRADYVNARGEVESKLTGERVINEGSVDPDRLWDIGIMTIKDERTKTVTAKYVKCGYNLKMEGNNVASMEWNSMVNEVDGSVGGRMKLERA